MANQRIEMLNLKHIIRLKDQGRSNREIERLLGVHRNTINSYVAQFRATGQSYSELSALSDEALLSLLTPDVRPCPRYEYLEPRFTHYEKELKKVGATMLTLWEAYRLEVPDGYGYTQFRKHLRDYLKQTKISLHWEHKFGDKLFVDYTGKKLPVTDRVSGEVVWKEVFVAILGGSGLTYVGASDSQQLDDFLEVMQDCFRFMGGVPRAVVSDNLKSAVTKADNYEPDVNRNFKALGLHYDTVILPTRAIKPKDKALVEGAVKLAYQQIFYPLNELTFFSLKDLNRAITERLDFYNNKKYQRRQYSRRQLFEAEEKHLLLPLPSERFERRTYRDCRVNKDAHVYFNYHYYSVPYRYVGRRILLQATAREVEIFLSGTAERIAIHSKNNKKGGFSTQNEHLPSNIRFVKNWSVEQFTSKAGEVGEAVYGFFTKIFEHKAHPEQAYKACMGILSLKKGFSDIRINNACRRADYFQNYSYKAVKKILEKGLDKLEYRPHQMSDNQPVLEASHPNIRGADYYK